ncbi:MAG: hypothetical protein Q9213_007387 [Squamulea squamosa]
MAFLLQLLNSKLHPPSPPTTPFTSRTILVTGANSGLGLEAAQKFISLGAQTVILACRTIAKAEAARSEIAERTGCDRNRMQVMQLDMASFASIRGFVEELRKEVNGKGLDVALLNAGVVQFEYEEEEGWERTLGVNVLGTTFLGMLLLPLLNQPSSSTSPPAATTTTTKNLVFVSSGNYQFANLSPQALSSPNLLRYYNRKENFAGPEAQYNISKLFLMYAANELAAATPIEEDDKSENNEKKPILPSSNSNSEDVETIITSVNPGATATNLTRNISGLILRLVAYVYLNLLARTAEQGSRSLVTACALGRESHGGLWQDDALVE